MARLTRVTNKIFGKTASPAGDASVGAYIGQFGSAKIGTYNGTGDVEEIQALPAWDNGWIDAVIPDQQYPTLPEMTGFGKVLSYQTGYIMQEGICEWDSATEYCKNSIVKYVPETITYSASANIGASTGVTGASVDVDTFTTQITADGDYDFTFDGSAWQYEGVTTNLTLYGITYTGTPATDDVITITLTSTIYRGDGTLYISLTDENINNNPSNDVVNWLLYSSGANKDLSNLSPTGQAVINSKVSKSGDTMTGTLEFDKSLNGISTSSNVCCMRMNLNHTIDANNLPSDHVYGNGRVMSDNADKRCFREYDRYSTGGVLAHYIQVTNYDAGGTAHNATLAVSVNNAGDTNFSFPMCETKPTTTSSAAVNKVAVITENYVNGNSWYRVWSDGWIEQGGKITNMTNEVSVSLLKSFSNTNYNIVNVSEWSSFTYDAVLSSNKTKNSFKVVGGPYSHDCYWRACGY